MSVIADIARERLRRAYRSCNVALKPLPSPKATLQTRLTAYYVTDVIQDPEGDITAKPTKNNKNPTHR